MGKFDGILLCTDLDGTLLDSRSQVSEENSAAIEYFKSEGGSFTFVTGRVPHGAKLIREFVKPNMPIVVFNGGGIFDFDKDELLWGMYLDEESKKVIEYVENTVPGLGLVVCTDERVYFPKMNKWVDDYYKLENFPLDNTPYQEIPEAWKKALFIIGEEDMPQVIKAVEASGLKDNYDFVRSCAFYYELLPKGASKGAGLMRLAELCGIDKDKIIAVGDNENDISMLREAKIGVAVANATDTTKAAADLITVSNNEHAIAQIISDLENKKIVL